jgi:hypothetical protein
VLLQGFSRESLPVGVVFVSIGIGDVSTGFGHARTTGISRSVHPRRCSRASSPRAWAHSRR